MQLDGFNKPVLIHRVDKQSIIGEQSDVSRIISLAPKYLAMQKFGENESDLVISNHFKSHNFICLQ